MEYTIKTLATLSGISARTLRYYDEIGLLKPTRASQNGYRIYGQAEVDLLQQILFYRALGMPLNEIQQILSDPAFDRPVALEQHLSALLQRKAQIDLLIENVQNTIRAQKGEQIMNDHEKFKGLKQELIAHNEAEYGQEIRAAYGDQLIDESNAKLAAMSKESYQKAEALNLAIRNGLRAAMADGDPAGENAQKVCSLHREWLCLYWPDGHYSKEAHRGLASMYVADERFTRYYDDAAGTGAAKFLQRAIEHFTN